MAAITSQRRLCGSSSQIGDEAPRNARPPACGLGRTTGSRAVAGTGPLDVLGVRRALDVLGAPAEILAPGFRRWRVPPGRSPRRRPRRTGPSAPRSPACSPRAPSDSSGTGSGRSSARSWRAAGSQTIEIGADVGRWCSLTGPTMRAGAWTVEMGSGSGGCAVMSARLAGMRALVPSPVSAGIRGANAVRQELGASSSASTRSARTSSSATAARMSTAPELGGPPPSSTPTALSCSPAARDAASAPGPCPSRRTPSGHRARSSRA